ncbi:hypothetical protein BC835DRAFT_1415432 [Cytidiella melzeri]|nr:hypothetical protein BC835DRAFT_1415432 [Cytidiella melzeri]
MDRSLDSLWDNQLVPLSAFSNDDFDNGTVTFRRITHGSDSALSRRLLSPLLLCGKSILDVPILFHVTGILHHEDCSLASQSTPGSTEETVTVKLCFKELPESVSQVEWAQCATAFWWLNMLACKEFIRPVETQQAFYNDSAGRLHIVVQGAQINPLLNEGIRNQRNDGQVLTHPSGEQRLDDRNVRRASLWPNIWFDSLRKTDRAAAPVVASGLSVHQPQTYTATRGYEIHTMMDHAIRFTSISQLPTNVPMRVTFSLELQTEHPLITMHAKIAKITILVPYEHGPM